MTVPLGYVSVISCASHPIRMQDSLIINIFRRNPAISYIFLLGDSHQAQVASGTTLFGLVWPVVLLVQFECRIF